MNDAEAATTIESRVRGITAGRLATAGAAIAAYLTAQKITSDITEVLSRVQVHAALLKILDLLRQAVITAITAGYQASAKLAHNSLTIELDLHGYKVPEGVPALSGYLDAVLADVRSAIDNSLLDLHDTLRAATDGADTNTRTTLITPAVQRVMRRLGVSLNSAAAVAAHRGHTDATVAILRTYAEANPGLRINKTWVTGSANPCPSCAALNGTTVAHDAEFDRNATTAEKPIPVYRDLLGPPRHPNCRCKLRYTTSAATAAYRRTAATTPPVDTTTLAAADIRRMPSATYRKLVRYLVAALRRLKTLRGRIRRGQ